MLGYLIDPTSTEINRLFVPSIKNGNDDPARNSVDKYYMLLVEIKYFNTLIDNKPLKIFSWKTKEKRMKNLSKCQKLMTIQQETY